MVLESEIAEWSNFRRALRKQDRSTFDDMMTDARKHASACGNAVRLNPTEALLMAIILEHEKELTELRKKVGV
jgi:hypothetical protein